MNKILLIVFLFISAFSFSQERSMKPIMNDMNEVISVVESQGSEVVKVEFDIVSSDVKTSYRVLYPNLAYSVGVLGDYRAEDMDVEVYKQKSDGTYEFVISDTKVSDYALVYVYPTEEVWYKFVIKCYKFKPGYSSCHYGLVIVHQ
jgi:Asp-tRNA(Asn)/Glu-tRNA(Gln) amidotransferase A subunit family amidase